MFPKLLTLLEVATPTFSSWSLLLLVPSLRRRRPEAAAFAEDNAAVDIADEPGATTPEAEFSVGAVLLGRSPLLLELVFGRWSVKRCGERVGSSAGVVLLGRSALASELAVGRTLAET